MKEEFLHYLWKYNLYDPVSLVDGGGHQIRVINPGEYNRDSGPDFFNARLVIDGTEWAGNVEIHLKSSGFDSHGHNTDPSYDNVILHVVADNDRKVYNSKGEEILTVEITFNQRYLEKYENLINNPLVIACQTSIKHVDAIYVRHWLSILLVERMRDKSDQVLRILSDTGNDWEETFYRLLSRYFGFRINTEPFERLAEALPLKIIRKHSDNRFQVEALLYGTAGMLEEGLFREAIYDEYYRTLVKEYRILSAKYSLKPLHGMIWKFSRLRPSNFPTVRISQLAAMLSVTGGLFSHVVEAENMLRLKSLLGAAASYYWDNHFVFGRKSRHFSKQTGQQAADIFIINAVIPSIFAYGQIKDSASLCEKALSLLDEIDPEENVIVDEWISAGIIPRSAFFTQALIQLRNSYCRKRRCLECHIGGRLIGMGKELEKHENLILEPGYSKNTSFTGPS